MCKYGTHYIGALPFWMYWISEKTIIILYTWNYKENTLLTLYTFQNDIVYTQKMTSNHEYTVQYIPVSSLCVQHPSVKEYTTSCWLIQSHTFRPCNVKECMKNTYVHSVFWTDSVSCMCMSPGPPRGFGGPRANTKSGVPQKTPPGNFEI